MQIIEPLFWILLPTLAVAFFWQVLASPSLKSRFSPVRAALTFGAAFLIFMNNALFLRSPIIISDEIHYQMVDLNPRFVFGKGRRLFLAHYPPVTVSSEDFDRCFAEPPGDMLKRGDTLNLTLEVRPRRLIFQDSPAKILRIDKIQKTPYIRK